MSQNAMPLSQNEAHRKAIQAKARLLKAIANPVRLCIMEQLVQNGEMNVSEMVNCMGVSQSLISQHLAKLRDQGFVNAERRGTLVFYSCKNNALSELIQFLTHSETH
jgi:ArsR family transcriptional regulator